MSDTFLTKDEVREMTLYARPAQQCQELDRIGIQYIRNRLGRPVVLRQALVEFFQLKDATKDPEINLDALRSLQGGQKKKN